VMFVIHSAQSLVHLVMLFRVQCTVFVAVVRKKTMLERRIIAWDDFALIFCVESGSSSTPFHL